MSKYKWSVIYFYVVNFATIKVAYKTDDNDSSDENLINDYFQTQHNLFWRVTNKIAKNRSVVEIKEMSFAKKYTISIKEELKIKRNCILL